MNAPVFEENASRLEENNSGILGKTPKEGEEK
jgi:hypothetical protein